MVLFYALVVRLSVRVKHYFRNVLRTRLFVSQFEKAWATKILQTKNLLLRKMIAMAHVVSIISNGQQNKIYENTIEVIDFSFIQNSERL